MNSILFVATVVKTHIMQFHLPCLRLLKDMGWTTAVAARNDYDDPVDCRIPHCDRFYPIPFARSPLHLRNLRAYFALRKLLNEESFDLIHCHTPVGAALTRLAARDARKKGTKVIYTAHGFHFYHGAPLINWLLYYPMERILAARTDVLITINREDYALAQRLPAKRVEYVPGVGIDYPRFAKAREARSRLRAELGLREDEFALLTMGELIPRKNHELVLRTLAELKEQGRLRRLRYVICGQGKAARKLRARAAALGLEEVVLFLGYRQDTERIYGAADAFVLMSRQEGLPVALMEAMASGLPCLCSNIRGNRDLIRSEETGLLVPFDDKALGEAILRLEGSAALQRRLGDAAALAARAYDLPAILAHMKAIYLSAASREQPFCDSTKGRCPG